MNGIAVPGVQSGRIGRFSAQCIIGRRGTFPGNIAAFQYAVTLLWFLSSVGPAHRAAGGTGGRKFAARLRRMGRRKKGDVQQFAKKFSLVKIRVGRFEKCLLVDSQSFDTRRMGNGTRDNIGTMDWQTFLPVQHIVSGQPTCPPSFGD